MKVRNGFVSNSSSSSFCIYGVAIEESEVIEIAKKLNNGESVVHLIDYKKQPYELNLSGNVDMYEIKEYIDENIKPLSMQGFGSDYGDYIGRDYTGIGDDETGKEFKTSIETKLKELLGKEVKCSSIEESTYEG